MRAIQVTCPQCGAALHAPHESDEVTCEYCGAVATVPTRRPFVPPRAPQPAPASRPAPARRGAGPWIAVPIVCALGGLAIALWAIVRSVHGGASWQGNGPIVSDIDNDGTPELIGRSRRISPDEITIVALDAATGKVRWTSPVLGTYDETYRGHLRAVADLVVFASDHGKVTAFDHATGQPRWTAALPDKPTHICPAADGAFAIVTADGVARGLRVTDGQPAAASACPAPVRNAPSSDEAPDFWDAVVIDTADGGRLVSGARLTGTHVAQLAKVGAWKVAVAADPLAAEARAPEVFGANRDLACASYQLEGSPGHKHVACFALADGTRRWDVQLDHDEPLDDLTVTDRLVLVSMWGYLEARDPATGKELWRY